MKMRQLVQIKNTLISLVAFMGCGAPPPSTDIDDPTPQTDTDSSPPSGTPLEIVVEGNLVILNHTGSPVGLPEDCEGDGTLYYAEPNLSGDFHCTFGDDTCTVSFRDQPVEGDWQATTQCGDLTQASVYMVGSSPPDFIDAGSTTTFPVGTGYYLVIIRVDSP